MLKNTKYQDIKESLNNYLSLSFFIHLLQYNSYKEFPTMSKAVLAFQLDFHHIPLLCGLAMHRMAKSP